MSARKASGKLFLIQGSKMEGALNRLILSDDQWERAAPHLPGKVGDPDFEYALIDGTIIRVHQHGTGAKGGLKIRRSDVRAAA
jgi:hypothetical protein